MLTEQEIAGWLRLLRVEGVGPVRQQQLLQRFGSVTALFEQAPQCGDLPLPLREALKAVDEAVLEQDQQWLAKSPHNRLLTVDEPDYPPQLRSVAGAPLALFLVGRAELLQSAQIAMVGSRHPSRQGSETAIDFARYFASVGLTVTSGLAQGIDGASHQGALDGGGETIAVLGTGPDRIYPSAHRNLAHRMVDSGSLLVSEFSPNCGPIASNFPRRNRVISALSLGTLVVEAALQSGSLITARYAAEQGREVFAIPGSIHNPLARGCNALIKQGAKLVESGADVLEEIAAQLQRHLQEINTTATRSSFPLHSVAVPTAPKVPLPAASPPPITDPEQLKLLEAIGSGPTPTDRIIERSGLTPSAVSAMLLELELSGTITLAPAGYQLVG